MSSVPPTNKKQNKIDYNYSWGGKGPLTIKNLNLLLIIWPFLSPFLGRPQGARAKPSDRGRHEGRGIRVKECSGMIRWEGSVQKCILCGFISNF